MSDCAPTNFHLTFCHDKINFHWFYCPFMSFYWQTNKEFYWIFWFFFPRKVKWAYYLYFWAHKYHPGRTAGHRKKWLMVWMNIVWVFSGMIKSDISLGKRGGVPQGTTPQITLNSCKSLGSTAGLCVFPLPSWKGRQGNSPVKEKVQETVS